MNPQDKLTTAERAARVVALRSDRRTFAQIGDELGVSAQRAHQIWSRVLVNLPAPQLAEYRAEEEELISHAVNDLLAIARDPRSGARTRVEAWSCIRSWAERRAKLWGLDAPARARVTVIDDQAVDEEIRRLTVELGGRADAGAAGNDVFQSEIEIL